MEKYTVTFIAELFNVDVKEIICLEKRHHQLFSLYQEEMTSEERMANKIRKNKKAYKYSIHAIFAFAMILPENEQVKAVLNLVSDQMTFSNLAKSCAFAESQE